MNWNTGLAVSSLVDSCFLFLALSLKRLDLSLAYPIWTGIGAVGSILVGLILFHDQISPLTWLFIALLIIGIIGIKVTS